MPKTASNALSPLEIEVAIHLIRGQHVLLDADLAALYGVTTSALNQAVKRNLGRFPADFMFQLEASEAAALTSQNVISKGARRPTLSPNRALRCCPACYAQSEPWASTSKSCALLCACEKL